MLYQTDIYTTSADSSELYSDLSVKIHGAAMKAIPTEYAGKMHSMSYHPFSIFSIRHENGFIIRVSALTDEASVIPDTLARLDELKIYGLKQPLKIVDVNRAEPIHAEHAGNYISENGCKLTFVTPAMIKTGGIPSAKPDICSYFYSVILKLNEYEAQELSYEDFQAAINAAQFGNYQLSSSSFNAGGHRFPGMTGYCELIFPGDKKKNQLLRKVIAYSTYSGIGGKTGQGMGGVTVESI